MNISLGGDLKYCCFHPIGEDEPILTNIFSDGLKMLKPENHHLVNVLCI